MRIALILAAAAGSLLIPSLAVSWAKIDPTTWEFHLRPGVKFSDGSPFSARDVVYSFCRATKVENSANNYVFTVSSISQATATDALTVRVITRQPDPLLAVNLSALAIISANTSGSAEPIVYRDTGCEGVSQWPKTSDFNNLTLAIGTGPFKFVRSTPGDRIVLARNELYWGRCQTHHANWDHDSGNRRQGIFKGRHGRRRGEQ